MKRRIQIIFTILFICSFFAVAGAEEKKRLFDVRHDESVFGRYVASQKIEGSLPSNAVCVNGSFLYSAGPGHVTIYSIADPRRPRQIARIAGLGECRQIDYYRGSLYVTARTYGMYIFDVQDPFHPRLRAEYDTMELATGIKCDNGIACIAQRQFGTEFVDISDPGNPRHLGYVVSGEAQSIDRANGILYVGDWGTRELTIVDSRDPRRAKILSRAPLDGLGDGVYVKGDICYAATGLFVPKRPGSGANTLDPKMYGGHGLDIYSVCDLRKPKLLGRIKFPRQPVHLTPDYWAVAVTDDKLAYVADAYNGFFCLDVSDPNRPVGRLHTVLPDYNKTGIPDPVGSAASVDGVFYLAGCKGGVYLAESKEYAKRIGDTRQAPSLPQDQPIPTSTDPNFPSADFKVYMPGGQVHSATFEDEKTVWLATGTTGIQLVDFTVETPSALAIYPTKGFAYDVKKIGNRLYTAEGLGGMAIYSIDSLHRLRLLGRFDCGMTVRQVTVPLPGKYALAKAGNNSIHFLDISNPKAIQSVLVESKIAGILYGRDLVDSLFDEKYTACTAQGTGLLWFDLSGDRPIKSNVSFPVQISFADGAVQIGQKLLLFHERHAYWTKPNETGDLSQKSSVKIPDLPSFGKASASGNLVCFTSRRFGDIVKIDFSVPEKPIVLKRWKTHTHPDLALFQNGKIIVPCGYAGLLIEK